MDELIGRLFAAVKDAGLEDSTNVLILSDHGFLPIEREIRPNVLLAEAGLLETPSGARFDGSAKGKVVLRRDSPGGTHGYLPFRKELEGSFIAWRPSIKRGGNFRHIPMTAIGPTILRALGIENPQFGVPPPEGILR